MNQHVQPGSDGAPGISPSGIAGAAPAAGEHTNDVSASQDLGLPSAPTAHPVAPVPSRESSGLPFVPPPMRRFQSFQRVLFYNAGMQPPPVRSGSCNGYSLHHPHRWLAQFVGICMCTSVDLYVKCCPVCRGTIARVDAPPDAAPTYYVALPDRIATANVDDLATELATGDKVLYHAPDGTSCAATIASVDVSHW